MFSGSGQMAWLVVAVVTGLIIVVRLISKMMMTIISDFWGFFKLLS